MVKQLLSSKLKMPDMPAHYLQRPRLTEKLRQLEMKKLTIIEATAGSGKSMLVVDYFQQTQPQAPIVWLNLSDELREPALFWSYVMEGLKPYFKLKDEHELSVIQSQFMNQGLSELLVFMLNQLTESHFYFVIDDVHLLTDATLLADLEFFIQELPATVHCVLLSRKPLPFYVAQWQLAQQLLVISQEDLALTETEAVAFMEQASSQGLTEEEQQVYWQFSEGWIGGLQLLLANQPQKTHHQLAAVTVDKGLVYDYLKRELYMQMPTDLQVFLLTTVRFSYFNAELCQALFPERSFAMWISLLQAHHIMLQTVNSHQLAYRYHHLFEEFFLQEKHELTATQIEEAMVRGLRVFVEQGDLEEAIKLALALKDYEQAMPLILKVEQPLQLFSYMKQVPNDAMLTNFGFTLQKFFFHYINMEVREGIEIHQLAIAKSQEDPQYAIFKGLEYLVGEQLVVFEIPVLSNQMIQALEVSDMTKCLLMIRNVSVLFYQCRYREGLEQVRENKKVSRHLKSDYLNFFNLNMEAQFLEEMGYLTQSLAVYRQTEQLIKQSEALEQLSNSFELSYHISILGTYLKQMNMTMAKQVFAWIAASDLPETQREALLYNQIEYWYLTGQQAKAWHGLQELMQSPVFADLVPLSSLLKYALKEQQLPQQFKTTFKEQFEAADVFHYNGHLLYAQLLAEEGQGEQALVILDKLLLRSRKDGVPLKIIEGSLLKIKLIMADAKRQKEAQDLYREAIYYGCSEQAKQGFFFEQQTLKQLFQHDYQTIVDSLSGVELAFHQELVAEWKLVQRNPLTERETEVLKEIAKSQMNKEIAKTLFISEATVKTHILNVYRKLEVNSRVAAVEKGQQLEILEKSN